ncbi:MAG: Kef-type K+ transport system membrane component KefB, partial [Gammaproteobacteria bacterium]
MHDLQQLALIWASVFIASWLTAKTKLTPVLYFLAAGCVMVNIGWLPVESTPFIEGFSDVGIILIMFALGFEANLNHFVRSIKRSWGIALFGAIAPFIAAYTCAQYFWGDDNIAILCGLTMTATAVSLTMVSLKSEGLHLSNVATGIMTSAVIDDIASLALVAILVPIATGTGDVSFASISIVIAKAILFFIMIVIIAIWIMPHRADSGLLARFRFLRRFGMMNMLAIDDGSKATLSVLLVAISISILAHYLGLHPAIGAYMAGLIIKEEYFNFGE